MTNATTTDPNYASGVLQEVGALTAVLRFIAPDTSDVTCNSFWCLWHNVSYRLLTWEKSRVNGTSKLAQCTVAVSPGVYKSYETIGKAIHTLLLACTNAWFNRGVITHSSYT